MGDRKGTPGVDDKSKAWLHCESKSAKQMGKKSLSMCTGSGKLLTVLGTACWWYLKSGPLGSGQLYGAWRCETLKMAKSWFKSQYKQGAITMESLLRSTLFLMICIHNFNSCVRCVVWQYLCFTCESWNMSSINKRSTGVIANFKKSLIWMSVKPKVLLLPTAYCQLCPRLNQKSVSFLKIPFFLLNEIS